MTRQEMISFEQNGKRFNHRVAGVCLNESRVLLQTIEPANFWILPGGRADEMGENSATALRREIREEIGCDVRIERLL